MTYTAVTMQGKRQRRITFTNFKSAMRYYRRELGRRRNVAIV